MEKVIHKLDFGFSSDIDPTGSFEGIGIQQGSPLISAEYCGAISYEGDDGKTSTCIVAKVTEDEFGRYPELLDNFIVMDAIYDLYADGSGTLYLDQEQSEMAKRIQKHINDENIKPRISDASDILRLTGGIYCAPNSFRLLDTYPEGVSIPATTIRSDVFAAKRMAINSCKKPFSVLQQGLDDSLNQQSDFGSQLK